ncbi:uncharacterized protein LOC100904843 [Galendromus occidentalis]|uniref:Uncharacterized protein LOC100904843 n=1 Tax=Galendromus occidentalis TaxID=34638 RepID=A0AAJ6QQB8_9ACAR|nr:uncharacterized protein LOC100904843 [Galendromus occidentalis]
MKLSTRAVRGLGAGCLAVFVAHLVSISVAPAQVAAVSTRSSQRESNEAYGVAEGTSRRLRRQIDGRIHARPGYKLIRVKAPNGRRRTTTTTTTPPPDDYYYYEVPEDEVPETTTTTTRRPVRQRQRIRQPQRIQAPPPPSRGRQRVRRPPQDYYEYNDVPSVEEESEPYGYATQKPRSHRPVHYDDEEEDERPRKKPTTSTTTTTTTTTTTVAPKPTTTLSPGYKTRPDGRIIDYLADPNFPRELNGADLTEYPFYISVPDDIKFDCDTHGDGFFASIEHHCQLFHYCFGGYRYSFLCPNYTVYDQTTFTCRFINTVQCDKSKHYYKRNDALFKEKSTTSTTTTVAPPTVAADTIAKEAAKALKRAKPTKSKSTTTTTEAPEEEYEEYEEEYEDETPSPESSNPKPSLSSSTTTTTTTTTTSTTSRPPPLLAGRKARLNRLKLQKSKS